MRTSLLAQLVKDWPVNAGDARDTGSIPRSQRSPGEGNGNQRSLSGYNPWGHKESDMTECVHTPTQHLRMLVDTALDKS